jgi:hypothetical protein
VPTAAVLAAGLALFLLRTCRNGGPENGGGAGFREGAEEAGIGFRMNFLPSEQGENFKINLYDHGCGVAIADVDGDDHEDIYFLNQLGPNALYRNRGDGTFEEIAEKAGVALGDRVCVGAAFGDFDNDGYPDLYVTSTRGGNVLFHNKGKDKDGRWLGFEEVTARAGVGLVAHSQTAVFFDYDGDGYLDLFVTNTARWTLDPKTTHYYPGKGPTIFELAASEREYNVLYHNNGNGTFTDVTEKAGLKGQGWGGDVAVFDHNGDGRPDLLVTNMFGRSQLYRNNPDGTFTDVARQELGRTSFGAIGAKVFDFNNDGRLDLLIVDMHSDMWLPPDLDPRSLHPADLTTKYPKVAGLQFRFDAQRAAQLEQRVAKLFKINYDEVVFGNTFYKRLPSGQFEEISNQAGLETWWPWGIATGDFDNDGFEDIFLPSGMGYPYAYWPNALLMNNGDETFTDRARELGIEPPPGGEYLKETIGGKPAAKSSRCAAVADFDGDGRLELVVNNFNDHPYYFRNHFPRKNWIAFRLEGLMRQGDAAGKGKSNRDAIGALVTLHAGEEIMVRQVNPAGGYLSQSSRTVHFGLGKRQKVDRVEIRWPSGKKQRIDNPAINQLHKYEEPPSTGPGA